MSAVHTRWLRRPELWALAALLVVAAALRLWFMLTWRPAFLGFPDSGVYIGEAISPFSDHLRPAGYGRFLALLHALDPKLSFVPLVQHALGLASGVLVFAAMRCFGAQPAAALVPAAAVLLSGTAVFLEHSVLSEALFVLLLSGALLAVAIAGRGERAAGVRLGAAAAAGVLIGLAVPVRLAGLFVLPALVVYLLLAGPAGRRARLAAVVAFAAAALVPIGAYQVWHHTERGRWGFTLTGFYNSYGRVGMFADCSKFSPPAGTRRLCPAIPRPLRPGHGFWVYNDGSPLVSTYGEPRTTTTPKAASGQVGAFVRAAVVHQPGDYLETIGRDLWRLVDPWMPLNPNLAARDPGNFAAGYRPDELIGQLLSIDWETNARYAYEPSGYYTTRGFHHRSTGALVDYERATRLNEGVPMALLLVLALIAPLVAPPGRRLASLLLLATAVALIAGPILTALYDARYAIPALGPLTGAAGLAVAGLASRVRARRRSPSPGPVPA